MAGQRPALPRHLWLLLFLGPALSEAATPPTNADDVPPKLISTTGTGAPKSKWKNLEEIKRAAEKGDPAACGEYAILLEQGNAVPKDFTRALHFYEQAAQGGIADSAFRLATFYHDGIGVPQDYAKAFDYYQQAARKGNALAQYNVGSMLVSARGMKRDWVEGLAWIMVATQHGADPDGERQVRKRLAAKPETIAAAERRALELGKELLTPKSDSPVPPAPPESIRPPLIAPPVMAPTPPARMPVGAPGQMEIKIPVPTPQPLMPEKG